MTIIFSGNIGRFPVGGNSWVNMQYLLGLSALGHEVFYLEDCGEGSWVYNWETEELTTDLAYPTAYVRDCLEPIGFGDRWIYRAGDRSVGMPEDEFRSLCSQAALLILLGSPLGLWRSEYEWPQRRVFIDLDPGFTQIHLAKAKSSLTNTVQRCERLFTIGQRIGAPDCTIPTVSRNWATTVVPVSLSHWPVAENDNAVDFTTVMQWRSYEDVLYNGISYGNKNKEFPKFIHLPSLTSQPLRVALTGYRPEQLLQHGWKVETGWMVTRTPSSYQDFVQRSRAEFTVAKHGYVQTRGGWFSDRSVCYLASGRPVLIQDTGLADWLPVGKGLLTFHNVPEALRGIEAINAAYEPHRRAARSLAEEYFAAERVLPALLEKAMS